MHKMRKQHATTRDPRRARLKTARLFLPLLILITPQITIAVPTFAGDAPDADRVQVDRGEVDRAGESDADRTRPTVLSR